MTKFTIKLTVVLLALSQLLAAQDDEGGKLGIDGGFDLASTYLWRGFEFSNGPVVQPWAAISYGNLAVGAWASSNFAGDTKEIDLFASYSYKSLTVSFTDLYTPGIEGLEQSFFDFGSSTSSHVSELGLSLDLTDKLPLTISGGMLMYGLAWDPSADDATALNHSTYFEIGVPGSINDYSYNIFAGFTPGASAFYLTDGFSVFNIGAEIGKEISVTESFSIPVTVTLAANPNTKQAFVVLMCSF